MNSVKDMIVRAVNDGLSQATLTMGRKVFPCALGKQGIALVKREGDMCTPQGNFPLRTIFYRYDKLSEPIYSQLPITALLEEDGWCDDPDDQAYNQFVMLPYPARAECLWRDDDIYDVVIVLGHNDDPIKKGEGSAIFLHVAREVNQGVFEGTEGCIALRKQDLLSILPMLSPETTLKVLMK